MLQGSLAYLLRQLRAVTDATDGEVLERFAIDRDEVAFRELVSRYGALVWKVCIQVLDHEQDAEDAFQAAFLVLACKAGAIRKQQSLGSWLYGVAYRTAMKARTESARRKAREQKVAAATSRTSDSLPDCDELAMLHEEIQRLPAKYRLPVVVCCLEGKTRTQAARQLGWKEGTVAGRLAEAKKLLQRRLQRRGMTLAAESLAAALVEGQASATAPAALAASTVRAALLFAAGEPAMAGVLSARVVALADKVARAMLLTKCQTGAALLLALTVLAVGAALVAQSAGMPQPDASVDKGASTQTNEPDTSVQARTDNYGDPLPPGAVARLGTVRFRHGAGIVSLAFAPDGRIVGTGSGDLMVHLWDPATGKEVAHFGQAHTGKLSEIAFSPDGKTFAAAGSERICLFDRSKLTVIREREIKIEQHAAALAYSPDGALLASGSDSGNIQLWEVVTGKEVLRLKGHRRTVPSLAFSPEGKVLASGIGDEKIHLWDTATGRELHALPVAKGVERGAGPAEHGPAVAFSPRGNLLAGAIDAKTVCLWDPVTGKEMSRLPPMQQSVCSLAFSPDSELLAVGCGGPGMLPGGLVVLWQMSTAKVLRQHSGVGINTLVAFSPNGKVLAAGGSSSALHLWETATGKELFSDRGHQEAVHFASFAADGRHLVTSNFADRTFLWDAVTAKELAQYPGARPWLAPDGKTLLTFTGNNEITVHVWDVLSHQEQRQFRLPRGNFLIAVSPDGKTFACRDLARGVVLWDVAQVKELRRLDCSLVSLQRSVFSANGRILALTGVDRGGVQAWLWDLSSGNVLKLPGRQCLNAAFSPDGKVIAGRGADYTLRLWDAATGKELRAWRTALGPPVEPLIPDLADQEQEPISICFSPDGRMLATGNRINQVRLWEVATGKSRLLLDGQRGWPCFVTSLAFSPDGKLLVSGSLDSTALVWALGGGPATKTETLGACWAALMHEDAARAYQAMSQLAAFPLKAVALLKNRLRPAPRSDLDLIARLISDLDSDQFATRDKAAKELENLGEPAEAGLRKALAGTPSAEARRRIEGLLARLEEEATSGERLRALRAVEVLEQIGTAEARHILQELAAGAPAARLTREAEASLDRLAKRFSAERP